MAAPAYEIQAELLAAPEGSLRGKSLGRFAIQEPIGAGGMGEVYRAHDETLDRDVALKVLPAGNFRDETARARLVREARSAAALNHPHICTVHEVGEFEGLAYIAMELVPGQVLSARLATGPLSTEQIVRYATQLADALAHAHERGVIHRDFKSANVIVTPEGRVKVLDFGLAKRVSRKELDEASLTQLSLTQPGLIAGTLAYMAPEQLRGRPADARSDIWAMGVMLYEMATGEQPFGGRTGFELSSAILNESPQPLRAETPDELKVVIERCLEKEPGRRYQMASEVRAALEAIQNKAPTAAVSLNPESPFELERITNSDHKLRYQKSDLARLEHDTNSGGRTASAPAVSRSVLARPISWLAAGGLMVLLLIVFWIGFRPRAARKSGETAQTAPSPSLAAFKNRRSVAVLGFKNLSERSDATWLSTALSEMLTTELAAGEKLRAIPGEDIARMKIELSLVDTDSFAKDTLDRIRKNLGTDLIVLGSYVALGKQGGGQIRLDLRLQDTLAGETIASMIETGAEPRLFDLVARTGARLREKLGAGDLSPAQQNAVRVSLPANPEAARLYSEGLARLRLFETLAARELLEKAVTLEPGHAQAHSALAGAWSALGYDAKAREEARKAFDLSDRLSTADRLSIEGRYRETTREWSRAVEVYRTLFDSFPDNLDYGLRLAAAQTTSGKGKESLATLQALRALPDPAGSDARIYLAEAAAARSLADYKRATEAAARGAEKGAETGARLVVARARFDEGSALHYLGELEKAKAALEEAHRQFTEAGDRVNAARSLNNAALVVADQGDLISARKMLEQVLAAYRVIGNQSGVALAVSNLGNFYYFRGDLGRAVEMWEQSLRAYREIGEKDGMARMLNNIASALALQGDLAGARKSFQQAYETYREIGNKDLMTTALLNIGKSRFDDGDLSGAKKNFQEALANWREIGNKNQSANALHSLGQVYEAEGDLAAARRHFEEELDLLTQVGQRAKSAETRLALAGVALEQARHEQAQALAREAVEEFQRQKMPDDEASAHNLIALSLLEQGKRSEAQQELERSQSLLRKSENRRVRLSVAISGARLHAVSGKSAAALASLRAALVEATKHGLISHQLDARLAMGELELKSANPAAGRARLEALEKDARKMGFGLIARKAAVR